MSAVTEIVVLHYPAERRRNWDLLRAAARDRDLRLVTWAPHLIGLWCADGEQYACYAGKRARPGIVIHRTVAPFRGIALPVLTCLAAGGSLVLNPPDAAFRSRDKLLTTLDLARAGIPVVPTVAFDEPAGGNLAALGPGGLVVKPARGIRGVKRAVHMRVEHDRLPADIWPRLHRGRCRGDRQVGGVLDQIERAANRDAQRSCVQRRAGHDGVTWPVEIRLQRHRAQVT